MKYFVAIRYQKLLIWNQQLNMGKKLAAFLVDRFAARDRVGSAGPFDGDHHPGYPSLRRRSERASAEALAALSPHRLRQRNVGQGPRRTLEEHRSFEGAGSCRESLGRRLWRTRNGGRFPPARGGGQTRERHPGQMCVGSRFRLLVEGIAPHLKIIVALEAVACGKN